MATLSATRLDVATGAAPAFVACAAGGDEARTDDRAFAVFKNGDTVSHTVTAVVPGNDFAGQAKPDKAYTVTVGGEVWVPLSDGFRSSTGKVSFTYDAVTSMTVAIVKR